MAVPSDKAVDLMKALSNAETDDEIYEAVYALHEYSVRNPGDLIKADIPFALTSVVEKSTCESTLELCVQITSLLSDRKCVRKRFADEGLVELLFEKLSVYKYNIDLKNSILRTLQNLIKNKYAAQRLRDVDGIIDTLKLIDDYNSDLILEEMERIQPSVIRTKAARV